MINLNLQSIQKLVRALKRILKTRILKTRILKTQRSQNLLTFE